MSVCPQSEQGDTKDQTSQLERGKLLYEYGMGDVELGAAKLFAEIVRSLDTRSMHTAIATR